MAENDLNYKLRDLVMDPSLEELELKIKAPNIFTILKSERIEIRHSNFIGWLLDPKGSHNLNKVFLRRLLQEVFQSEKVDWADAISVDTFELDAVEIRREWKNIDLTIVAEEFVVAVEIKVDADESKEQLRKYKDIVENAFHDSKQKKAFVFLTVDGHEPKNPEDAKQWIPFSYNVITDRIDLLLNTYQSRMSERTKIYISDYLTVLRRNILSNDTAANMARSLYRKHKDAIDFILDKKTDDLSVISDTIKGIVVKNGYIVTSCNGGFVRFLTSDLHRILPRTGDGRGGWNEKESFAFEFEFTSKKRDKLKLKIMIPPGEPNVREMLTKMLVDLLEYKKKLADGWRAVYSRSQDIDFLNLIYEDEEKLERLIEKLLIDCEAVIKKVSSKICENEDALYPYKSQQ
jgi:PD-(D/E)XK nuclease superfamily protein